MWDKMIGNKVRLLLQIPFQKNGPYSLVNSKLEEYKRSILNALYLLFNFNLLTILCRKSYHYAPFMNEESEAWKLNTLPKVA